MWVKKIWMYMFIINSLAFSAVHMEIIEGGDILKEEDGRYVFDLGTYDSTTLGSLSKGTVITKTIKARISVSGRDVVEILDFRGKRRPWGYTGNLIGFPIGKPFITVTDYGGVTFGPHMLDYDPSANGCREGGGSDNVGAVILATPDANFYGTTNKDELKIYEFIDITFEFNYEIRNSWSAGTEILETHVDSATKKPKLEDLRRVLFGPDSCSLGD